MYRKEQKLKNEKLMYSVDLIDEVHIVDVFEIDEETSEELNNKLEGWDNVVLNIRNPMLFDFVSTNKSNYVGELIAAMKKADFDSYVKGSLPELTILREGNLSLKYDFLKTEHNPELHKYKVRQTIQEYSKGKKVLNLFPGISDLTISAFLGGATEVTEVEEYMCLDESKFLKKLNDIDSDLIETVQGEYEKGIEYMVEKHFRFDLVVVDLSVLERDFPVDAKKFKTDHKDIIRNMQHILLEQNGILILISDDMEFHLDNYIRPGADKLTKYLTGEEYSPLKLFHGYAFYK
jgi:23S rRNA G2069 N7-methylase RlmK/C1962 C5-methylase RlmI